MLRGLTLPATDRPSPVEELARRHAQATCRAYLALAPSLGAAARPIADAVRRALLRRPQAVLECFQSPTVATPIHAAPLGDELPALRAAIGESLAALSPHLALELATRRLLGDGEELAWPAPVPRLASLALGVTIAAASGHVLFSNGALRGSDGAHLALSGDLAGAGFVVTRAYRPLGRTLRLALVDDNPLAALEAHPDKHGSALDLGGRSIDEWVAAVDHALGLVAGHLPGAGAEMALLLRAVVPVGHHPDRHLSASYREAIGSIYLSLHPNPLTMAEALLHEHQHTKLNLASHSVALLDNAFGPLYRSPVRPDARPLFGILLAVHAFLPVAVMLRNLRAEPPSPDRDRRLSERLSEIDLKNHEGMAVLRAHGRFTSDGKPLFEELDALDRAHMAERAARGESLTPIAPHAD